MALRVQVELTDHAGFVAGGAEFAGQGGGRIPRGAHEADHAVLVRRTAGHQDAAGRDAGGAFGVAAAEEGARGAQPVHGGRLQHGVAVDPQAVASLLVGDDEQHVGPALVLAHAGRPVGRQCLTVPLRGVRLNRGDRILARRGGRQGLWSSLRDARSGARPQRRAGGEGGTVSRQPEPQRGSCWRETVLGGFFRRDSEVSWADVGRSTERRKRPADGQARPCGDDGCGARRGGLGEGRRGGRPRPEREAGLLRQEELLPRNCRVGVRPA